MWTVRVTGHDAHLLVGIRGIDVPHAGAFPGWPSLPALRNAARTIVRAVQIGPAGKKEARASRARAAELGRRKDTALMRSLARLRLRPYEQPVVAPQVSHFRQVPLRTRVKLAQLGQGSPS
jgi:hypothetical protein